MKIPAEAPGGPVADQRENILTQAAALFARSGYRGTSMNDIAAAAGLSKATLYHYYREKDAILVAIAEGHVSRLLEVLANRELDGLTGEARLERLIARFMDEYAHAQHSQRVLTEDVRYLKAEDRDRIVEKERRVVQGFADAIAEIRPDLADTVRTKPLAMLLMGMLNWMFTWWDPAGRMKHDAIAPLVFEIFTRGLVGVGRSPSEGAP